MTPSKQYKHKDTNYSAYRSNDYPWMWSYLKMIGWWFTAGDNQSDEQMLALWFEVVWEQEKETNDWIRSAFIAYCERANYYNRFTGDLEHFREAITSCMPKASIEDGTGMSFDKIADKIIAVVRQQSMIKCLSAMEDCKWMVIEILNTLPTVGSSREVDEIIEDFRNGSKSYSLLRKNIIDYVAKTVWKTSAEYACLWIEKILPTASNEVADELYVDGLAEIIAKKTEWRLIKHPKIDKSYFPALVKSIAKEVLSELLPHTTPSTPLKLLDVDEIWGKIVWKDNIQYVEGCFPVSKQEIESILSEYTARVDPKTTIQFAIDLIHTEFPKSDHSKVKRILHILEKIKELQQFRYVSESQVDRLLSSNKKE